MKSVFLTSFAFVFLLVSSVSFAQFGYKQISVICKTDPAAITTLEKWPGIKQQMDLTVGTAEYSFSWIPSYDVSTGARNIEFDTTAGLLTKEANSAQPNQIVVTAFKGVHLQSDQTEDIYLAASNDIQIHVFSNSPYATPAFATVDIKGTRYFSTCSIERQYTF